MYFYKVQQQKILLKCLQYSFNPVACKTIHLHICSEKQKFYVILTMLVNSLILSPNSIYLNKKSSEGKGIAEYWNRVIIRSGGRE